MYNTDKILKAMKRTSIFVTVSREPAVAVSRRGTERIPLGAME